MVSSPEEILPSAKENLEVKRLSSYYYNWLSITNDKTVLSWVEGYRIPFVHTPQQIILPENNLKGTQAEDMQCSISHLQDIGAIIECQPCKDQFLSHIFFLTPKPNGDKRFILNLKNLNKFVDTSHFKLEDIRTATKLLSTNPLMAKIDLKEAYFSVSVHKLYRRYLRFKFQNKIYEFQVLPFGLSTAPYIFTKMMKPVIEHSRKQGIVCTVYLDDIFSFLIVFQRQGKV